ncbi:hypothetical protein J4419_02800 [Candidatus Woesearchaeota archaeon]|nr:hypothetical protein [Candidatus Woesearchaeota archaeon]
MAAMNMELIGRWAFIVGLVVAVIAGFVSAAGPTLVWLLAFLGLVVGLLNVAGHETHNFLLASVAFVVSASSLALVVPMEVVRNMLQNVVTFVGPAAGIVAIKSLFEIAKSK